MRTEGLCERASRWLRPVRVCGVFAVILICSGCGSSADGEQAQDDGASQKAYNAYKFAKNASNPVYYIGKAVEQGKAE